MSGESGLRRSYMEYRIVAQYVREFVKGLLAMSAGRSM